MTIPPEIEAKGMKAYEQVRAFESLRQRGLPWIYLAFSVLLWITFIASARWGQNRLMDYAWLIVAVFFSVMSRANWITIRARYAANLHELDELRRKYGDDLPWLKIERHLAMLEEIRREEELG